MHFNLVPLKNSIRIYFFKIWFTSAILLLFSIYPEKLFAQVTKAKTVLDILSFPNSIPIISDEKAHYVLVDDKEINTMPQFLLKGRDKGYVFVNGSGRLYEMAESGDTIKYERIDTTYFSGYNIGSFPFIYNDTIFSLGGSGFWRINGQLRVYVPKTRQWDIVELNKEVPILYGDRNELIWYDIAHKRLYIGKYFRRDQATKSSLAQTGYVYEVKVLNIITKEWTDLGNLSEELKDKASITQNISASPWGQFVMLGENYAIIDYPHNRILYLKASKRDQLRPLLATANGPQLFYFKDSTFFYGSSLKNKLDSIKLSLNDFSISPDMVYTADNDTKSTTKNAWLFFIPLILFIPIGLWTLRVKQRKKQTTEMVESSEGVIHISKQEIQSKKADEKQPDFQSVLEEVELQTFALILKNTLSGNATSIEELNKVLGVSKKSSESQKKQRSDTITAINSKYHFSTGEKVIIQKRRCDFDKRSFEYYIDLVKASEFKKVNITN